MKEINIKITKDDYIITIDKKEFKSVRDSNYRMSQNFKDDEIYNIVDNDNLADEIINSFTFFNISNELFNDFCIKNEDII